MEYLTPAAAASRAKTSRPTISRALKDGELPGIRDNSGRWRIQPADLDIWAANRPSVQDVQLGHRANSNQNTLNEQMNGLKISLAAAESRADAAEKRAGEIAADRDRWQGMAEALRADLAAERSRAGRPIGFFARIFGG